LNQELEYYLSTLSDIFEEENSSPFLKSKYVAS